MAKRSLVYIAFITDSTNTPDSRRVGCLSTVSGQIRDYVAKQITNKRAAYFNPDKNMNGASCHRQAYQFLHDWDDCPGPMRRELMNGRLKGVFLDTAFGGREYTPADDRK